MGEIAGNYGETTTRGGRSKLGELGPAYRLVCAMLERRSGSTIDLKTNDPQKANKRTRKRQVKMI